MPIGSQLLPECVPRSATRCAPHPALFSGPFVLHSRRVSRRAFHSCGFVFTPYTSSRLSFTHVASAVVASRAARSITSRSLVASSSFFYGAREHHAQHFLLLRVLPGLGLLHARFSSFRVERMRAGDVGSSAPSASTVGGAGHCRRPHVSHSVLLHTYRRMSVTSHVRLSCLLCAVARKAETVWLSRVTCRQVVIRQCFPN